MRYFFLILMWLGKSCFAEDESTKPLGCKSVGYRYQLSTLELQPRAEGDKESLYFFYNKSAEPIKLYHLLGTSAYIKTFLNHTLEPQMWAGLITGEEPVKFLCARHADDQSLGEIVNCQKLLTVCEFPKTRFGINNRGNFWLVKSAAREAAVRQIERYGIVPE
jgi:hypothetical protein